MVNQRIHRIWPQSCFLFPKFRLPLPGTRFRLIEGVKENSQGTNFKAIPEIEVAYLYRFIKRTDELLMKIRNSSFYFQFPETFVSQGLII